MLSRFSFLLPLLALLTACCTPQFPWLSWNVEAPRCSPQFPWCPWYSEPSEGVALLDAHVKRMSYKYQLELVAVDIFKDDPGSETSTFSGLTVVYYGQNIHDLEKSREIAVDCFSSLICTIYENEALASRFAEAPTKECIEVQIDFDHFFGEYFESSFVGHIIVRDGWINYYSFNNELTMRESLESAEELICGTSWKEHQQAEYKGCVIREKTLRDLEDIDDITLPCAKPHTDKSPDFEREEFSEAFDFRPTESSEPYEAQEEDTQEEKKTPKGLFKLFEMFKKTPEESPANTPIEASEEVEEEVEEDEIQFEVEQAWRGIPEEDEFSPKPVEGVDQSLPGFGEGVQQFLDDSEVQQFVPFEF